MMEIADIIVMEKDTELELVDCFWNSKSWNDSENLKLWLLL